MTPANDDASTPDPVEAIAAALGRLRGRGRGPHGPGPHGHGGPHEAPRRHDGRRGGPHGSRAGAHGGLHEAPGRDHGDHGDGPWVGRGGRRGPWAGDPAGRHGAPAVFRMLEALANEDLSVSALGEAIGVDQPRASRLVQQGVVQGWVRREADPDDARRTRIALTDEGRTLVRGVRGQRRELLGQALDALSVQERAELARLLTKLADNWPV